MLIVSSFPLRHIDSSQNEDNKKKKKKKKKKFQASKKKKRSDLCNNHYRIIRSLSDFAILLTYETVSTRIRSNSTKSLRRLNDLQNPC